MTSSTALSRLRPLLGCAAPDDDGDDDPHRYRRPPPRPSPDDDALLAIVAAPRPAVGALAAHFDRLEARLATRLAQLAPAAAHAMHARLAHPHPDDALAVAVAGLTAPRRQRLLDGLAGTRRRHAVARAAAGWARAA
ncbi:MAG: hypothetical protein R2939_00615 [Kofleriaceae bacterium]